MEKHELQQHRKTVVRSAARNYQLAYACLRGRPYAQVERVVKRQPPWNEITRIVSRFSNMHMSVATKQVDAWRKGETTVEDKMEIAA